MTSLQACLIIAGWVIGFISSIGAQHYLERRRAFRAVRCACHSVEFRLTEDSASNEFHRWSIGVLEAPFFAGIGFLNYEDQQQASEIWGNYQSFNVARYPEDTLVGMVEIHFNLASATRAQAMRIELEKISSLFQRFP